MGSECGHFVVDVPGLKANPDKVHHYTVEGLSSGTGLLRRAKEMGFQGKSVEELVETGDPKYDVLFADMAFALAVLCHNLSIAFNLEKIFISGGLIKIKDLFFKDLKANYSRTVRQINTDLECKIEIAKTKNNAGVLGAGYLPHLYGKPARKTK
jgi:glucokinase